MSVGGAVKSAGARGASYIGASQGRQTAFILIVAILLARLALTNQLQTFWSTLWGQSRPLGAALPAKVSGNTSGNGSTPPSAASNGGGSAGGFALVKPPQRAGGIPL